MARLLKGQPEEDPAAKKQAQSDYNLWFGDLHSLMVLSLLPLAITLASGVIATQFTVIAAAGDALLVQDAEF